MAASWANLQAVLCLRCIRCCMQAQTCQAGNLLMCLATSYRAMVWRRLGPMVTVLIGVALQFGGYYGMYMAALGRFDAPYYVMLLLAFAACNGQTWYETAGLVTSVRNFETERCAHSPWHHPDASHPQPLKQCPRS